MNDKEYHEYLRTGKIPDSIQNKTQAHRVQREGGLQIACVKWFRLQYPAFSTLLFHPRNEADGAQGKKIAINAAAGVVPGVPDLILAIPAEHPERSYYPCYCGLGIELKYGKTNNQSAHQKKFQKYWEGAGYKYVVCRSIDDFIDVVNAYMEDANPVAKEVIKGLYHLDEDTEYNKKLMQKIAKKKAGKEGEK